MITCTICTDLVQVVDEALVSNQTIGQIEGVLDAMCDILVGMEDDCKGFVSDNLAAVIDLLVNEYLSPDEVCEDYLGLCP